MRALILLLALLAPVFANAATLYVNNSGSPACDDDTVKASNSAASPWCTIARAAWGSTTYASPDTGEAASAGDVVLITAGTYTENGNTSGNRWTVALNPANSGTSGNLITFRGVGDVYVRLGNTIKGPMIGCDSRDYIAWDNLIIDDSYGGSQSDTGPVVFHVANYCQLTNSEVLGHNDLLTYPNGDATFTANYCAVRLEYADNTTVKNNTIHRVHNRDTGGGGENDTGILLYETSDAVIEHNEIYDTGQAAFVKGTFPVTQPNNERQARNLIRYNYVHDNDFGGIRVQTGYQNKVYQNIVTSSGRCLWAGYNSSEESRFINNTVYNCDDGNLFLQEGGSDPPMVDVHYKNNIVVAGAYAIKNIETASPTGMSITFDRNLYYAPTTAHAGWNLDNSPLTISFDDWQGTYTQDANGLNGSAPLFVNGTPTTAAHFKLQGGSPALTLGRVVESIGGTNGDTIPAGAYITGSEEIGIEGTAALSSAVRRFTPFNLRR